MEEYVEDTKYKIETTNRREMDLMLNASRMALVLYDIINWKRAIYNGKNYGEGHVVYKGKMYSRDEWEKLKHTEDEYDKETHFLKEKVYHVYTEEELENKLDYLMRDIYDFVYNYYE